VTSPYDGTAASSATGNNEWHTVGMLRHRDTVWLHNPAYAPPSDPSQPQRLPIFHYTFFSVVIVALLFHYMVTASAYHCSVKHRVSRLCGCRLRRQQHGSHSVSIVATVTYGLFSKASLGGVIVPIRLGGWEDCLGPMIIGYKHTIQVIVCVCEIAL
jgi:hypothetical protein